MGNRLRRFVRSIAALLLGSFLVLVLIEGLSSVVYVVVRLVRDRTFAEEHYTRYDPDLGWISEPHLDLPDFYGPGLFLRTNGQSFRNAREIPREVPPGMRRAVCSGDSFTFGYGVDNDHTWCQALATLVPGLETVNMGQGGYGVDQAYLWFKRDAQDLRHQAHLFAFITNDFARMQSNRFIGYGKPLLRLEGGRLAVTNTPVPKPRFLLTWLSGHSGYLQNLASFRLGLAIQGELRGDPGLQAAGSPDAHAVAAAIFSELLTLNRAKGSRLALIYLPTLADYRSCEADEWRQVAAEAAAARGIPFVDLIPELRKLPAGQADRYFLKSAGQKYFAGAGHYTVEGNAWIAGQLAARRAVLGLAP